MSIKTIIGAAILAIAATSSAQAVELVTNGGFEQTTCTNALTCGAFAGPFNATGWTLQNGLAALAFGGQGGNSALPIYGPGTQGGNNGFTDSPTGGNYFVGDGDTDLVARIRQDNIATVIGKKYTLTFDWAAGQQSGFPGPTTESWKFLVGPTGVHFDQPGQFALVGQTNIASIPQGGFAGWFSESVTFTANSTNSAVWFIAAGTPNGMPPLSLLDNVSITAGAVPEPSSWAMLIAGFGLVGAAARRRRSVTVAA